MVGMDAPRDRGRITGMAGAGPPRSEVCAPLLSHAPPRLLRDACVELGEVDREPLVGSLPDHLHLVPPLDLPDGTAAVDSDATDAGGALPPPRRRRGGGYGGARADA